MKRLLDLATSVAGLIVLGPLLLLVSLLIAVLDGRPVFFRQQRVGQGGKPFRIWKFRTMVPDASARGGEITVGGDPRITRLGHWLRKTKLDELPQLLNVLRGEMSVVGPRPEVPRYVAMYTKQQRGVLEMVPGITDPASIAYRDESEILAESSSPETTYVEKIMVDKIRINLAYASQRSVTTDILVVVKTIARVLLPNLAR